MQLTALRLAPLFLALAVTACTGAKDAGSDTSDADADTDADTDSDTDSDTDTDTDTDTDADADLPTDMGFELDGAFYPLTEEAVYCQTVGAMYVYSSGALRDGTGAQANGYAYFGSEPTPGDYTVVAFDGFTAPGPGEVGVAFLDTRDNSFWYSNGTGGTLFVSAAPDGESTDVVWHNVVVGSGGVTRTTTVGWLRC